MLMKGLSLTAALARESWESYTKHESKGRDQVGPSGTCCRDSRERGWMRVAGEGSNTSLNIVMLGYLINYLSMYNTHKRKKNVP